MSDVILTGASRGIGRALALALAGRHRLILVARDRARLDAVAAEVAARGGEALVIPGDLASLAGARTLGARLAAEVGAGAILVHMAGLWPKERELTDDGLESAYVVNHAAPMVMQQPLLDGGRLARIMVVSAGLIAAGRFDPARTPTGEDFSSLRTYCSTKLAFAVAMRDVAALHPEVDVVALHPGIVRTDLGARTGLVGALLSALKRLFESPETCAARLARLLEQDRWSPPGEVRWLMKDALRPWPRSAEGDDVRRAVREASASAGSGRTHATDHRRPAAATP